jgi:centromere/kinetochore protein ZW10
MASSTPPELGQVLVDFSVDGRFPEDEAVSAARVKHSALPAALTVLREAKADLEVHFLIPFEFHATYQRTN